jgi:hypothetical protein
VIALRREEKRATGAESDRGSLGEPTPHALNDVAPATPATARRGKERRPNIVDMSFASVSRGYSMAG